MLNMAGIGFCYILAQSMQNIEIMPRYSTIYCVKTNIPFGKNLIPEEVTAAQASIIYAEEADVLNVAMFELMLAFRRGLRLVPARTLGANTRGFSNMVETKRNYEIVEGRPELQVELTCTNPECGNVWIRRFPTE